MLNKKYQNFAKWNIYQIYPRSFFDSNNDGNGDLQGVILKLDYLKKLGINAIWLSPFFASPMFDNGYDISDFKKIDKIFGTMSDFEKLIQEAHARNIKIIIDLVANHTSTEHFWFKEARKSKDNYYHNYYYFFDEIPNNWQSCFSESAYEYVDSIKQYYLHSFAKEQADLNWNNKNVRDEIKSIVDFYVKKGVDGFRCDVLDMISKDFTNEDGNHNGEHLHEYINELFNRKHLKNIFTVGECWSTSVDNLKLFIAQNRHELITSFQGDVNNVARAEDKFISKPFKLFEISYYLDKWQKITQEQDLLYSLFLENHDNLRIMTKLKIENIDRYYLATMLATMVYLLKGVTYIYQGQEIGMENPFYNDINDFNDVETLNYYKKNLNNINNDELLKRINFGSRDNARRGMCWDNSLHNGFSKVIPWIKDHSSSLINVKDDLNSKHSIYHFYQKILNLRNNYLPFTLGKYECVENNEKNYIYKRKYKNESFLIIINFENKNKIKKYNYSKIVLSNYNRKKFPKVFFELECLVLKLA